MVRIYTKIIVRHFYKENILILLEWATPEKSSIAIKCMIILLLSMVEAFRRFFAELKAAEPSCPDIARQADFEER